MRDVRKAWRRLGDISGEKGAGRKCMYSDEMSVLFRSDRVDRESGRSAHVDAHAYLWRRRQCALNSRV